MRSNPLASGLLPTTANLAVLQHLLAAGAGSGTLVAGVESTENPPRLGVSFRADCIDRAGHQSKTGFAGNPPCHPPFVFESPLVEKRKKREEGEIIVSALSPFISAKKEAFLQHGNSHAN